MWSEADLDAEPNTYLNPAPSYLIRPSLSYCFRAVMI
jgi:hypothetical protein